MAELLVALVNGVTSGSIVFLVACGLTVVFGVAGVLNFAHGGVFMVAAFIASNTVHMLGGGYNAFAMALLAAIVVAALLSLAIEFLVVRMFYRLAHEYMLLGTFAALLIVEGAAEMIFGHEPRFTPVPPGMKGGFTVFDTLVPWYSATVIVIALAALMATVAWLRLSKSGKLARSAAHDPECCEALGVNVKLVLTTVFVVGGAVAGLAGAVLAPNQTVDASLASLFIVQAFAVIVVGGLGSVYGAYLAALLLGLADSVWFTYLPGVPQVASYVVMALVLAAKPTGLFGVAGVGAR